MRIGDDVVSFSLYEDGDGDAYVFVQDVSGMDDVTVVPDLPTPILLGDFSGQTDIAHSEAETRLDSVNVKTNGILGEGTVDIDVWNIDSSPGNPVTLTVEAGYLDDLKTPTFIRNLYDGIGQDDGAILILRDDATNDKVTAIDFVDTGDAVEIRISRSIHTFSVYENSDGTAYILVQRVASSTPNPAGVATIQTLEYTTYGEYTGSTTGSGDTIDNGFISTDQTVGTDTSGLEFIEMRVGITPIFTLTVEAANMKHGDFGDVNLAVAKVIPDNTPADTTDNWIAANG